MTVRLNAKSRPPVSGTTRSVVIFLHGYGADGADLLGLADPLGPHLPDTAFHAPDAPERCAASPFGYQWFPIPWIDGSSEAAAQASMETSLDALRAYVAEVLEDEGVGPERLILFGFSQGTMMSLHLAPRWPEPFAGVVGFSGRLLAPERLEAETVSRPPVLLVHGDADEVVPFEDMHRAGQALTAAGFTTYAHRMAGTGHGIAPDGLSIALAFMRDCLSSGAD
jgi:phospholipase/carboxylesterase